jgi:ribosomal protein S6
MARIYEVMYLLDNNAVRAGWKEAKSAATGLIEKHGGKVLAARRWDERKLAYSIRLRRRGTYLLAHAELPNSGVAALRRELDLNESVLRYLILGVESVPPQELELTRVESEAGFIVPPPPLEEVAEDGQGSVEVADEEDSGTAAAAPQEMAEEEV